MGHGKSTSASTHKRQTLNCYSGCPSATELSSIWSFVLDFPSGGESTCEQELGLMSIAENSTTDTWGPPENAISQNASGVVEVNDKCETTKSSFWVGSSSIPELSAVPNNLDQPIGSVNTSMPKVCGTSVFLLSSG